MSCPKCGCYASPLNKLTSNDSFFFQESVDVSFVSPLLAVLFELPEKTRIQSSNPSMLFAGFEKYMWGLKPEDSAKCTFKKRNILDSIILDAFIFPDLFFFPKKGGSTQAQTSPRGPSGHSSGHKWPRLCGPRVVQC